MALLQPTPLSATMPNTKERGCYTKAPSQMAQKSQAKFPQSPARAHGLTNLVNASIVNADSALYNTVCRYHTSNAGNICVFGTSCHYLHFAHLERPRAHTHYGSQQPSEETRATFKAIKGDVIELRKRMSTIENMLQSQTTKTQHVDELKINSEEDALGAGLVQPNLTGNDEQSAATVHAPCESAETMPQITAKVTIDDDESAETTVDIDEVKSGTMPTDELNAPQTSVADA